MDRDRLVWWSSKQLSSEFDGRRTESNRLVRSGAEVHPGTEEPDQERDDDVDGLRRIKRNYCS